MNGWGRGVGVGFILGLLLAASFAKRSWLVVTTYDFTLRLQPDVAPALAGAVGSFEVVVTLPGRVRTSNAPRMSAGTALWDTLPAGPLRVQTRAVHWGRLVLTAIIIAALLLFGRGGKSGG